MIVGPGFWVRAGLHILAVSVSWTSKHCRQGALQALQARGAVRYDAFPIAPLTAGVLSRSGWTLVFELGAQIMQEATPMHCNAGMFRVASVRCWSDRRPTAYLLWTLLWGGVEPPGRCQLDHSGCVCRLAGVRAARVVALVLHVL